MNVTALTEGKTIGMIDLPDDIVNQDSATGNSWKEMLYSYVVNEFNCGKTDVGKEILPIFEKILISAAMNHSDGKNGVAAKLLGWGRNMVAMKYNR